MVDQGLSCPQDQNLERSSALLYIKERCQALPRGRRVVVPASHKTSELFRTARSRRTYLEHPHKSAKSHKNTAYSRNEGAVCPPLRPEWRPPVKASPVRAPGASKGGGHGRYQ